MAKRTTKKPAIVCGSEGEIANDPSVGGGVYYGAFDVAYSGRKTSDSFYRETVSVKLYSVNIDSYLKSSTCLYLSGRLL